MTEEGHDDKDLMTLIQTGDHQAFSILVKRHTQIFFNLAFRTVHNESDAQDVVQNCFLKLWQKPHMWSDKKGAKFTTWFYRVVLNACEDFRRNKARHTHKDITDYAEIYGEHASQERGLIVTEEQAELESAIADLPERQKKALNLVVYQELKQKEAADVLGVGVKALESLLSRAKSTLRARMTHKQERKNYATR